MMFSLLNLLQILIAFQGVFFALHLMLGGRGKRTANRPLAALLSLLAVHMLSNVAADQGWTSSSIQWPQLFALLYGPLLYHHVWALTRDAPIELRSWLHGAPFLTFNVLWLEGPLPMRVLAYSIFASIGVYLAASALELHHYRRVLLATGPANEAITLGWLRSVLRILGCVWALDVLSFLGNRLAPRGVEEGLTLLLFVALLVLVTWMVRRALAHPELFAGITSEDEAVAHFEQASEPETRPLSAEEMQQAQKLDRWMQEKAPFLRSDLTLKGLAQDLDMAPRALSRLIHRHTRCHFADFINGYRVDAAQQELLSNEDSSRTILDIAYAVGFNSKSSFNSAFKRKTDLTPSQFKERQLAEQGEA